MKKNSELEFMRFVAAMMIVLFHFSIEFDLGVFTFGNIAVEFFFLLTGVLAAKSAERIISGGGNECSCVISNTYDFLKKKLFSFYPYYLLAVVFQILVWLILVLRKNIVFLVGDILKAIPSILMIDSAGFRLGGGAVLAVDWYLSAMMFALFIIFPVLLYRYDWASKIMAPIVGIIGLSIIQLNFGCITHRGSVTSISIWVDLLRATSEILIGVWIYEISKAIKEYNFTKLSKILLTILKWGLMLVVIVFANAFIDKCYSVVAFIFYAIIICFSFSEITYNIPNSRLVEILGKLSLPIFLIHMPIRRICVTMWGADVEKWKVWIVIALCPVAGWLLKIATEWIMRLAKRYKYLFIEE